MARTGRPKIEILILTLEERAALERVAARPRSARNLAFRAKVILRCADSGKSNTDVARELRAGRGTVGKWRSRFIADRLDGLHDEPRPGAARKITDDAVEAVVTKTLESTGGSTSRAAEILNLSVRKIQYKLHEYESAPKSSRPPVTEDDK